MEVDQSRKWNIRKSLDFLKDYTLQPRNDDEFKATAVAQNLVQLPAVETIGDPVQCERNERGCGEWREEACELDRSQIVKS